jgi:3,4-dihydroxy-2-butanone 4-phosphate synthase
MWSAQCSCVLRVVQVQTYACAGVICVGLPTAECERLELPLMVATAENEESMYTAFTVTVDLRQGVTTGISASDRCRTIRALGSADTQASDLRKPGHIFPLIAREYGVLARPGHTEAAVDMARMAGMAIVLFCGAERHLGIHRPLGTHQQAAAHAGAQLACRRCLWSGRHNPQLSSIRASRIAAPKHGFAANSTNVNHAGAAGCRPAGVLCEVVDKSTGEMAQTPQLLEMAKQHNIHCVTIKDLIRHRVQHEPLTALADEELVLGELTLRGLKCIDGSRAAYAAIGDVTQGRPRVIVHEVRISLVLRFLSAHLLRCTLMAVPVAPREHFCQMVA